MREMQVLRQVVEAMDAFLNLGGLTLQVARKRFLEAVPQLVDDLETHNQTWIRDPEQFLADRDEQVLLTDRIKQRLETVFRALAIQKRKAGTPGEFDQDALDAVHVRLQPVKGKSAKGWQVTIKPTFADLEQAWLAPPTEDELEAGTREQYPRHF